MGADRGRNHIGVALDEADCLGHVAETLRIVPRVAVAGKPALPVRGQQPERIPPLRLPRVRHLAPLEDHVVDRAVGEAPTHGESGVPGPEYDGGGSHGFLPVLARRDQLTSTETLVGLVMMS